MMWNVGEVSFLWGSGLCLTHAPVKMTWRCLEPHQLRVISSSLSLVLVCIVLLVWDLIWDTSWFGRSSALYRRCLIGVLCGSSVSEPLACFMGLFWCLRIWTQHRPVWSVLSFSIPLSDSAFVLRLLGLFYTRRPSSRVFFTVNASSTPSGSPRPPVPVVFMALFVQCPLTSACFTSDPGRWAKRGTCSVSHRKDVQDMWDVTRPGRGSVLEELWDGKS